MKRDEYGIIIQPDGIFDGLKSIDDGGNSAFSTGLMAFGGSKQDELLMDQFITDKFELVRHPYQNFNTGTHPHNDPRATSRDQVISFFSGLVDSELPKTSKLKICCYNYAMKWRVNKDILTPAHKLYLYKLSGHEAPLGIKLLGYPLQAVDLFWNCFFNPEHEMNQAVVMNYVYGKKWAEFLVDHHPNVFKNLHEYFSGWRKRKEIAVIMCIKITDLIFSHKIY